MFSSRGVGGYLAFEKYDLFIYFIVHNVDIFICYPWIFIAVHDLFATDTQNLHTNNTILFHFGSLR